MKNYPAIVRSLLFFGVFASFAALFTPPAGAQSFPSRSITVIMNSAAGTTMDGIYRSINAEVSKILGQSVVMENRAGANGRLGVMAIKSAPADGHLITIANDSVLISQPAVDPQFQMEQGKDFQPVAFLIEFPIILVGRPNLPFRDFRGLVTYAKANPGKLNWAVTPGNMFVAEMLLQTAGINVTKIAYKGSAPSFLDIIGGRIDVGFAGSDAAAFFKAEKMVGLGSSGAQRWSLFSDIATFTEHGVPFATTVWYGLLAPMGTPPEVIAKLNDAYNQALRSPQITKQLESNGYAAGRFKTPREFSGFIQSELDAWRPTLRKSGIKLE